MTLATAVEDATDALTLLTALRALQDAVAGLERVTVESARADGISWGDLGRALSRSKQGVCRKYGPKPEPKEPPDEPQDEPDEVEAVEEPEDAATSGVWADLRVGPGRGVPVGRIIRRT